MLILTNDLINKQVLSIRNGLPVASVIGPIVNPNNLKIEGFYCRDRYSKEELILLSQDIRETVPAGYIVDDHDVLASSVDLVRLKEVLDLRFTLVGKPVVTSSGSKVGKISDYATDLDSLIIIKLYIVQPIYRHIGNGNIIIERNQITEITPRKIVVDDIFGKVRAQVSASVV